MISLAHVEISARMLDDTGFDLDEMPWQNGVNLKARFIPETLCHLYYTPSYQALNDDEKLQYNQFTGMALCEQFIFLEEKILAPVVNAVIHSRHFVLSATLRRYLRKFILEEEKHSELFWRLLQLARPDLYPKRELRICNYPRWKTIGLDLLHVRPDLLQTWVWLAILFEERTVDICRHFRRDKAVDPLFAQAHELHMREEVHHVALDRIFIDECFAHRPAWIRSLSVKLFANIMKNYAAPKRIPTLALKELIPTSENVQKLLPNFMDEIYQIGADQTYQDAFYSRRALPTTFSHMDRFPEFQCLSRSIPGYVSPTV